MRYALPLQLKNGEEALVIYRCDDGLYEFNVQGNSGETIPQGGYTLSDDAVLDGIEQYLLNRLGRVSQSTLDGWANQVGLRRIELREPTEPAQGDARSGNHWVRFVYD